MGNSTGWGLSSVMEVLLIRFCSVVEEQPFSLKVPSIGSCLNLITYILQNKFAVITANNMILQD